MKVIKTFLLFFLALHSTFSHAEFKDINGYKFETSINFLKSKKIITGYENGTFQPDKNLNRAEFTKILITAFYPEKIQNLSVYKTKCFNDFTNLQNWYVPYVCAAKDLGLVSGYPDGSFRANENIIFVEGSKVIALNLEPTVKASPDLWYRSYVSSLLDKKIIPTADIESFDALLTRGEISEMIARTLKSKDKTLSSYLSSHSTLFKTSTFPRWEAFNQQLAQTPVSAVVSNKTHPGPYVSGSYLSNYKEWTRAEYKAGTKNDTLSTPEKTKLKAELLKLLNAERIKLGKPPFTSNNKLELLSQEHATHLVTNAIYSHSNIDGKDPFDRALEAGYSGFVTESFTWGTKDPASAVAWWKRSSIHWKNLMNDKYNYIGIGLAGEPHGGAVFVVMTGE